MPKTPKGKRGIYAYLDENVHDSLWDYIKEAYPNSTYGAVSSVLQTAVVEFLRIKHTQIHTTPLNPKTPTLHRICRQIIQSLKDEGFIDQVNSRTLAQKIGEIRGSDKRTVRKWIQQLKINGYIKNIGTYSWEIL